MAVLARGMPQKPREQKDDVTTKLIASFKDLISRGILVPGCKLPSERELAQRFQVSRSSLRQALKVMEIMGVVSQRVGDGTYLSTNSQEILGEPLDFLFLLDGVSHYELFEARLILEPELAARAAQRATVDDLAELRSRIEALQEVIAQGGETVDEDVAFHDAIFAAAGNRVFRLMFRAILRAVFKSIAQTSHLATRGELREAVGFHESIYGAIEARRPDEARRAMTEHLLHSKGLLLSRESREQRRHANTLLRVEEPLHS